MEGVIDMPKAKYEPIYHAIRDDIESQEIKFGDFLPSENDYVARFKVSRNTIRRALSILTSEGFLLPRHGRGVQVIWKPLTDMALFTIGGIESFSEAAYRNQKTYRTEVITFREIISDKSTCRLTGFDVGVELYYIERRRIIEDKPVVFDTNVFLKEETPGLTKEIASDSIYKYLEDTLGMTITTSRRRVTAEPATKHDKEILDLDHQDFVLTVTGQVFNSNGVMFEYTQSRHVPNHVCFVESAVRQKIS